MKTVSLKLAGQLKEAGYPQTDSYFYYAHRNYSIKSPIDLRVGKGYAVNFASPTVDEILDRLPGKHDQLDMILYIIKIGKSYCIEYSNVPNNKIGPRIMDLMEDLSLADVAAKMWLYLKKKELI